MFNIWFFSLIFYRLDSNYCDFWIKENLRIGVYFFKLLLNYILIILVNRLLLGVIL